MDRRDPLLYLPLSALKGGAAWDLYKRLGLVPGAPLAKGCTGASAGAKAKYQRCVAKVKAKGGANPYAVCRHLLD